MNPAEMKQAPPRIDVPTTPKRWRATVAQWAPGLLVALAAGVATAHGLFEVALAAGTPEPIAWLYPLITDGLALVAYAATSKLTAGGRAYAWAVVVLAAGLSGLAQAVFLAGGVGTPDPMTTATVVAVAEQAEPPVHSAVAFGVGAWPAIAAAIVAHLLFMLGHAHTARAPESDEPTATARPSDRPAPVGPDRSRPAVQPDARPTVHPAASVVQPPALPPAPAPTVNAPVAQPSRPRVQPVPSEASSSPTKDRARAVAREHQRRTGALPTVTVLMDLADVARGTAGAALKELREQSADLHIVTKDENLRNSS